MKVPFQDFARQLGGLNKNYRRIFKNVIKSGRLYNGTYTAALEKDLTGHFGHSHALALPSASAAMHLVLTSLKLNPQDRVIMPALTHPSVLYAVLSEGATPVLCDVDDNGLIDADAAAGLLDGHTRAVINVHLYGQHSDLYSDERFTARLAELKERPLLIDDAAQYHAPAGQVSADCTVYSFYATKNAGSPLGGGALLCDDPQRHEALSRLAREGSHPEHGWISRGYNYRLSETAAGFISLHLSHLERDNHKRHKIIGNYAAVLKDCTSLQLAGGLTDSPCPHLAVIFTRPGERDRLAAFLAANGVETGIHFGQALHQHPELSDQYNDEDFSTAARLAATCLSLPLYPALKKRQVKYIARLLTEYDGRPA